MLWEKRKPTILMFPWLAHGHISPYLELAKKLAERDFKIYLCSTPATLNSIENKIKIVSFSISIQLIELNLPTSQLAPEYHTTNGLPSQLMSTLKECFLMGSDEFHNILKNLKPDLLIYDFLQPWAPASASELNIPSVEFITCNAANIAHYFHKLKNPSLEFPYPAIFYRDYELAQRKKLLEGLSVEEIDERRKAFEECFQRSCDIVLIKTFQGIEGKYCQYLSDMFGGKRIVTLGPLVQAPSDKGCENENNDNDNDNALLGWLQQQRKYSTVLVAFGTEYFLEKEDIIEIAHGLELSNANFIWVLRFPKGSNIELEQVLPKGFLQRVGKRGKVVQGWVPQAKILNHYAIGGFVSHCGWSSVLESLKLGVPIIALPMHLDQPINARLVEEVGAGVEVVRDKDGRIQREEIAEAIKQVLDDKSSLREKAENMRMEIQCNGEKDIDRVEQELIKLCAKYNKTAARKMTICQWLLSLRSLFASFFYSGLFKFKKVLGCSATGSTNQILPKQN